MQLFKIIEHSENVYSITIKTSKPADIILQKTYNAKRYIGSKERKFINELIFSALRQKLLNDFIVDTVLKNNSLNDSPHYRKSNFIEDEKKFRNIAILFSTIALELVLFDHPSFKSSLIEAIQLSEKRKPDEIEQSIISALSDLFNKNIEQARSFWNQIIKIINTIDKESKNALDEALPNFQSFKLLEARYSMPSWILTKWILNKFYPFTITDACKLAESYLDPAPITLRVNTEVVTREEICDYLNSQEISSRIGKLSPSSVIIERRIPLIGMNMYRNGFVEIQDEGSQIVSFALAPEIGATVLDACAGAGGKTMHIASIMRDSGTIVACDNEFERIKEIKYRAGRQNFHSIRTVLIKKEIPELFENGFDYVLIDAPCSGMGTVRRIPNPKWRLTPETLERNALKQLELLKFYSQFLNPGGVLVYSTCSSMFEENDEVIERFLDENKDFVPDSISKALQQFGIELNATENNDYKLHLYTHIFGCDTFFICRLRKIM